MTGVLFLKFMHTVQQNRAFFFAYIWSIPTDDTKIQTHTGGQSMFYELTTKLKWLWSMFIGFMIIWFILMTCQPILGYFMPTG